MSSLRSTLATVTWARTRLPDAHRRQKAHLVEAVIEAHHQVFRDDAIVLHHLGQQGQGEETVGNGATKRGLGGLFLVDVDKLVILGAIGKGVDALLADLDPRRRVRIWCQRR